MKSLTLPVIVALWAAVVATVVLRDLPTPAYMVDKTTKEVKVNVDYRTNGVQGER